MVSKVVKVVNAEGLHMRPANTFVTEMSKFSSDVDIVFGGKRINGKSIMNIMAGCIKCGSEITVECSGVSAVKTDVRVAVAADLMAFVFHAADEIFAARDLLADEEERRVRAALLEPVEQSCGRLRRRAVVKGQRNAAPQLGWGRDGDSLAVFGAGKAECKKSQQKQQQERETSFQDHHLSLYFTQQADKKDQPV